MFTRRPKEGRTQLQGAQRLRVLTRRDNVKDGLIESATVVFAVTRRAATSCRTTTSSAS